MSNILQPSVQSLLIQMFFNNQLLSTGTAFVMEYNHRFFLITNRHNFTGRRQDNNQPLSSTCAIPNLIRVFHNSRNMLGSWNTKDYTLYSDEKPLWHEHPQLGAKADFVALEIFEEPSITFYPYSVTRLPTTKQVLLSPAQIISVVGFPFGLTGGGCLAIWATGHIATEPIIDFDNLPIFLIDCRSRQGQSGSPVLYQQFNGWIPFQDGSTAMYQGSFTQLLGIYSGRINEQSDLGIVWKASAVRELILEIQQNELFC